MERGGDKSWINLKFPDPLFVKGVERFITLAQKRLNVTHIPCPCSLCMNRGNPQAPDVVEVHLYKNEFHKAYVQWIFHGESLERGRETTQDAHASASNENYNVDEIGVNVAWNTLFEEMRSDGHNLDPLFESKKSGNGKEPSIANVDPMLFDKNLRDALCPLYPGCDNFNVLRFVLRMFKIKINNGWSDKSFTEMLQVLRTAFPSGNTLPENTYHAEKLVKEIGLKYEKIDACPNDCILYWKEKADLDTCPTCKASRYKVRTLDERKKHVKSPAKQLRYFPITERLRRMYSVEWVAREMRWHSENQLPKGVLGHPVDSSSWEIIDTMYEDFASNTRNVRLGLATDGFNPFGMQSNSYSCWPVMCVVYNLPPWLCMKPQFTMLALLIDGPKQPGKDIDIYFRPLVDELKSLWHTGATIEDASEGLPFTMRAVLLWTIHDFPAYGDVSGHRVKSKYACPVCGPNTSSIRLHHGKKNAFLGNRCFLCETDPMRKDVRASSFNREEEHRPQPMRLSGDEIIHMTKDLNVKWGKGGGGGNEEDNTNYSCFCKLSIFFELEYWKYLPIRHNLDVMHIEKNVCEILLALMLDTPQKTKDDNNARRDLELLEIKQSYWLTSDKKKKRGPFSLRADEKKIFLSTLKEIRVPVGFSSSWYNIVLRGAKAKDLKGMKSHDYHILMEHLLPVLIQHAYKDRVQSRNVLLSFSTFFRALCSRRVEVATMKILERGMVKALCELEKMCPPSVFVIMMHLPIHLAYEARVSGPVFYRWMYLFERHAWMMKEYKSYVSNKARPEGCIAEAYLKTETMIYCDGYKGGGGLLEKLEECIEGENITKSTDLMMETEEVGPVGKGTYYSLEGVEYEQVRKWILKSHPNYDMWEENYKEFLNNLRMKKGRRTSHTRVKDQDDFIPWLRRQSGLLNEDDADIARGPNCDAMAYNKYSVNGFLFITKDLERTRRNQNSGVTTKCPTTLRSSAKDKNPIDVSMEYYGVLRKIIQVKYRNGYSPVVFKCDWVKLQNGVKRDEDTKLLMVNMSNILRSSHMNDEPFILAEHVSQVFYSKDPLNPNWNVVIEVPRKEYSDLDSVGLIPEETNVDESFVIPTNPESSRDDELIFTDAIDIVDVDDAPRKRKRSVVAPQRRKGPVVTSQQRKRHRRN